ncbi:MAG: XdhC family protein [Pleurocapsa minor GSE-CHR-MK-17-07R]|jgi:xanthine dehydrogenase accessory factor|nr:XdhC family protein [Pleurocapsa minor GSE-CHR-MK 17-07R]
MDDVRPVYEAILSAHSSGESAALATIIHVQGSVPRHAGSKMLVRADGSFVGTVGGGKMESLVIMAAQACIADGQSRTESYTLNDIASGDPGICGGTVQVFIEPLLAPPTLLVVGMGHVGKAVAELGKWMGYRVAVCDDRAEFCTPEYIPGMDQYIVCKPADVAAHIPLTPNTYVAAVTRGLPVDIGLIPVLLKSDAAYMGLIGSRRRWAITVNALKADYGLTDADLARMHAPIGLELGAETPREIALSILAEITAVRRGASAQPMRWLGTRAEAEAESSG